MKNLIQKMNQFAILQSIISILLGLFLLLWPQTTLVTIVYLFGAYLAVLAIINFISYWRNKNGNSYFNSDLISGILQAIMAVVIFIYPTIIIGILPFIAGITILLSSVLNLTRGLEIRRSNEKGWLFVLIISIVTAIFGVVIIINPFAGAITFVMIYGIMLLVKGVSDLITYIIFYISN